MSVTNPNEPHYPYGGGTDNPGDDTSKAGGPTSVASTETAPLTTSGDSLTASVMRHPPLPVGIAQGGTDTVLGGGVQAVPLTTSGLESSTDRGADTGGPTVDPDTGDVRVPGQDETAGETETTSGAAPSDFPEPTP